MPVESNIVTKASEFVASLFEDRLPDHLPFHTFEHTKMVARTAHTIGKGMKLGEEGIEVVTLAAWLHDVGYTELYKGHEEISVRIATEFLKGENYPDEKIELIIGCIRATKIPQQPHNLLEEIVADADLSGFGRKSFFKQSELLHSEWERALGKSFTEAEWAQQNLELLTGHRYFTIYAQETFSEQKAENIRTLYKRLRKMKTKEYERNIYPENEIQKFPHISGIDFHEEPGTKRMHRHSAKRMKEITLADSKAQTLLFAATILLTFSILFLLMSHGRNPYLGIPFLVLLVASSSAILYSILSVIPEKVTAPKEITDFVEAQRERDILLARKKHYVRIGYKIFMYGICTSAILFIIHYIILMIRYSDLSPK
jgi:predicted metal-dependent HD superfamily phosphohydrolase